MSRIDVDIDGARRANRKLSPIRNNIDSVISQLSNFQSSIDPRVLAERNLSQRVTGISRNISAIERDLQNLHNTLGRILDNYEETDRQLLLKVPKDGLMGS
jgi:uncharacterized protein YukE